MAPIVLLSHSFNVDGTKAEAALARPSGAPRDSRRDASPPTETAIAGQGADELLARALEEHRTKMEEKRSARSRQLIATAGAQVLQLKDDPERATRTMETQTLTEVEVWNEMEFGHAEYLTLYKNADFNEYGRYHRQYMRRLFCPLVLE